MALKLPGIKNQLFQTSKVLNEGFGTKIEQIKEFTVMPQFKGITAEDTGIAGIAAWGVAVLANNEVCYFNFHIPEDFTNLIEGKIFILPDTSETIQYDLKVSSMAPDTGLENNFPLNNETKAVTDNVMTELEMKEVLETTSLIMEAKKYITLKFTSNTSNIQVMGLRIRYS